MNLDMVPQKDATGVSGDPEAVFAVTATLETAEREGDVDAETTETSLSAAELEEVDYYA